MLDRLLVPLDAGEEAERVLPYVTLLAKGLGQPVALVSVIADGSDLNPVVSVYEAALAELTTKRRDYAQRYMDSVRERLTAEGVFATTEVLTGNVAEGILAAATEHDAGLIAMATHGRVGPERWFLGSVADRVVRNAQVPVLLIRPGEKGSAPVASLKAILLPLDGSEAAEAALPYATFLAQVFKVPVTVIRTLPLTWWSTAGMDAYGSYGGPSLEVLTALEDDAREYLKRIAGELRASGVGATTSFAMFRPPDIQITESAGSTDGALVVMTTHGRSGLGRTLLGSVTDRVIRSSAAPVLVIPQAQ